MRADWRWMALAIFFLVSAAAQAAPLVWSESSSVTVEKRQNREWCVLRSQASVEVPLTIDALLTVIEDYSSYPLLAPKVREASAEKIPGGVLLTEKVVVSALGIENVNRFTLRLVRTDRVASTGRVIMIRWTQEKTDGTIDSLEGEWTLEETGSADSPKTKLFYHTASAVPVVVFGQDTLIRMFLGGETRSWVEAVVKKAGYR